MVNANVSPPVSEDTILILKIVLGVTLFVNFALVIALGAMGGELASRCGCDSEVYQLTRAGCTVVPTPANSSVVPDTLTGYAIGSIVRLSCDEGFYAKGDTTGVCAKGGEWVIDFICVPLICPNKTIQNGRVDFLTGHSEGDEIHFSCDEGYYFPGSSAVKCSKSGEWQSDSPVACELYSCGSIQSPVNGSVWLDSTTYGSVANFHCDPGFYMNGSSESRCESDSVGWISWSSEAPQCQVEDCGELENPANGMVTFANTVYGFQAVFYCNRGYLLHGDPYRECGADGVWSGIAPECVVVNCGDPQIPDNGWRTYAQTTYDAVVEYGCNDEYTLVGSTEARCTAGGFWSEFPPFCNRSCTDLSVEHGSVQYSGSDSCQTATYSCNEDYILVGITRRTCTCNGWTDTAPKCVRNGWEELTESTSMVSEIFTPEYIQYNASSVNTRSDNIVTISSVVITVYAGSITDIM